MVNQKVLAQLVQRKRDDESLEETIERLLKETQNVLTPQELVEQIHEKHDEVIQIYAQRASPGGQSVLFTVCSPLIDENNDSVTSFESRDRLGITHPNGETTRWQFWVDETASGPLDETRHGAVVYHRDGESVGVDLETGAERLRDLLAESHD